MLLTLGLVVMVIFLFLRNVSATVIPSLGAALLHHRHLRGHVPAALQPGQPVHDGADSLGRLRRRRRHRDARKHLPAHGDGREAAVRGAGRIEGNRLHHRFDDAVARGGVHPGAVPGRHPGPAVPRIRRHHLRRDPDFGRCVGDADAHAVSALPALARRAEAIAGSIASPSDSSKRCCASTTARCKSFCGIAPSRCRRRSGAGRHRSHVHQDPEGLHSRIRIPTRSTP